MTDTPPLTALQRDRYRILGEIAALGDLRPGRIQERCVRCGRPSCHCQQEGDPGHGPYRLLQFRRDGRQTSRSLSDEQVPTIKAQLAEYQRFQGLQRELLAVSEQLCEARLAEPEGEDNVKKSLRAGLRSGARSRTRPLPRSWRLGRPAGLGSAGDGGAPGGVVHRSPMGGAAAERQSGRLRRADARLSLRADRPLCRTAPQDGPQCARPARTGAGLLPLHGLPPRELSA